MKNEEENVKGNLTAEKALKMLNDEGMNVTLDQARLILEFLRKLATITVSNYLRLKQ